MEYNFCFSEKDSSIYDKLLSSSYKLQQRHHLIQGETINVMTQQIQANGNQFRNLSSDILETVAKLAGCSKKSHNEVNIIFIIVM